VDQPESVVTSINVGLTSGRQAYPFVVSQTKRNRDNDSSWLSALSAVRCDRGGKVVL
jgi:hypothetical protein